MYVGLCHSQTMDMAATTILFVELPKLQWHYNHVIDFLYMIGTWRFRLYFIFRRDFAVPLFHPLFRSCYPLLSHSPIYGPSSSTTSITTCLEPGIWAAIRGLVRLICNPHCFTRQFSGSFFFFGFFSPHRLARKFTNQPVSPRDFFFLLVER